MGGVGCRCDALATSVIWVPGMWQREAVKMVQQLSNELCIGAYIHCGLCLGEFQKGLAPGQSPATYARLSVGWTKEGLQVWCNRHDVNVMHVDFQGAKHPANTTCKNKNGNGGRAA